MGLTQMFPFHFPGGYTEQASGQARSPGASKKYGANWEGVSEKMERLLARSFVLFSSRAKERMRDQTPSRILSRFALSSVICFQA